jgi:hypothetical protein
VELNQNLNPSPRPIVLLTEAMVTGVELKSKLVVEPSLARVTVDLGNSKVWLSRV